MLDEEAGEGSQQEPPLALPGAESLPPAARQAEPWVQQAYLARQKEGLEKQLQLHLGHSGLLNAQTGESAIASGSQIMVLVTWQPVGWQLRCGSGHTHPAQHHAGEWLLPATLVHLQKQFMPSAAPVWCMGCRLEHVLQNTDCAASCSALCISMLCKMSLVLNLPHKGH